MRIAATLWLSIVVCLPGLTFAQDGPKDPESLARQVLAALAAKNQKTLETLSIDQGEIKKYIWPTVSSLVSGGQMNAEKFSSTYKKTSETALSEKLAENGGKSFELVKVNTDAAKQYKGYRLLPNPEVTVRGDGGKEETLKLGSALIEREGSFKVASYYRAPTAARASK